LLEHLLPQSVEPRDRTLFVDRHGAQPDAGAIRVGNPLDDGRVAVLSRRIEDTVESLGEDGNRWAQLMSPFVERHGDFFSEVLRPIRRPRHVRLMSRFALLGLQPSSRLVQRFTRAPAKALFAGSAAYSVLPLSAAGSASFGLVLAVAGHAVDWPSARGGSQTIIEALATLARSVGCAITTGTSVRTLTDVPRARAVLFDVTRRQLLRIAGAALSERYRRQL
jgi:phytoene dehydrogenase-like protein